MSFMEHLAKQIDAHLKRFEADPKINTVQHGLHQYYHAGAFYGGGARLRIVYKHFQGSTAVTKADAVAYLKKLDKGKVGRHFELLR